MGGWIKGATLLAAGLAMAGCDMLGKINTNRAYNYAVITHASHHVNADRDFEEWNPGLGFGSEAPIRGSKSAVGLEVGRYVNSEDDLSSYVSAYWERDMLPNQPRRLRVGTFAGFAEYPDEVNRVDDWVPTIGNFIFVGGLQATLSTVGRHELRMRISPGLSQSDAVIGLQSNFKF